VQITFPDELSGNVVSSKLLTNDIRLCKGPSSSAIGGSVCIAGSVLRSSSSSLLAASCSIGKLLERVNCSFSSVLDINLSLEPKR
jgi:hypothetical protein